jgi:hypothetical protein
MLLIGIAAIAAVPFVVHQVRYRHDRRMTVSCANHAIQLKFLVLLFAEKADKFPLQTDARSAFMKMIPPGEGPVGWISTVSASCPESFKRDHSIGYRFVADGLSTKAAAERSALVFFCPADSHQGLEQHCHAVIGRGELVCIMSNNEMIELLRREINRGREGIVPYSSNAVAVMDRELKAREKHSRKQEPNKSDGANRRAISSLNVERHSESTLSAPPTRSYAS